MEEETSEDGRDIAIKSICVTFEMTKLFSVHFRGRSCRVNDFLNFPRGHVRAPRKPPPLPPPDIIIIKDIILFGEHLFPTFPGRKTSAITVGFEKKETWARIFGIVSGNKGTAE